MITILFSGDFAPLIPKEEIRNNHFYEIKDAFKGIDLHIINLECPLTESERAIEKSGPHIKARPEAAALLKQANVSIACLANNHILDYNEKGVLDTLDVCNQNGIECLGIISRPDGKPHWLVKEINGARLGFLNYCEHEFSVRENGLLGAAGYDPVNVYYDIKLLRSEVDWLIVIYHGGNEYYPLPRPGIKRDFHYLVDIGADLIVGHHTHVYSGYEMYKDKPIIYSLGNFFFPYSGEPDSWYEGILCRCTLGDTISLEFIPFFQCKYGFETMMDDKLREKTLENIENLSKIIKDDEKLAENWKGFVKSHGKGLAHRILFPTRIDKLIAKVPFMRKFLEESKRRKSLVNIVRCTSLKQLLIDNLKSDL